MEYWITFADRIATEARMQYLGIRRYRIKQQKSADRGCLTQVGAGEHLLAAMLPALEAEITRVLDLRRGRPSSAVECRDREAEEHETDQTHSHLI